MPNKKQPQIHRIVPNKKRGGWDIHCSRSERPSVHYDIKREKFDAERAISRNQGTEFHINNQSKRVLNTGNHGNDPHNIKGRFYEVLLCLR